MHPAETTCTPVQLAQMVPFVVFAQQSGLGSGRPGGAESAAAEGGRGEGDGGPREAETHAPQEHVVARRLAEREDGAVCPCECVGYCARMSAPPKLTERARARVGTGKESCCGPAPPFG